MNRLLIFCILVTLALSSKASEVVISFENISQIVKHKNERIKFRHKNIEASKKRSGKFSSSFLPEISFSGGFEKFEIREALTALQPYYGVEAHFNIYNGGLDHLKERIQILNTDIQKNLLKIEISRELSKARELYWRVVYLKFDLILINNMLLLNRQNLKAANRRVRSGVATPSDRLEFKMKEIELKRKKSLASSKIKSLTYDLSVLLGLSTNQAIKITGSLDHKNEWEADLKHTHEDHDYLVKPQLLATKNFRLQSAIKRRFWYPKVDLYAGWNQLTERDERFTSTTERQESVIGLKIKFNLFDRLASNRESSALDIEAQASHLIRIYSEKYNESHIKKEFLELETLHQQVHESGEYIELAKKYHKATQIEYTRGAKNSPDVLSATERLEEATRTRNKLIRDFQIARSHVLSKIGK